MKFQTPKHHFLPLVCIAVAALLALGTISLWPQLVAVATPDPVTAAWEKARAAGSYEFTSDVTQITVPVAQVTNIGRQSRSDRLHLEGYTDLVNERLALQIWSESGSVLEGNSGVAVKVEEGQTFTRNGAGEWQLSEDIIGGLAPQGDFMAYLAAVRTVSENPPEVRGGIPFTRYSFTIDGPTFAAYVR